jgi:hypothetical protein
MIGREETGGVDFFGCASCLNKGIPNFWKRDGGERVLSKTCVCKNTALKGMCTKCLEELKANTVSH